MSNTIQLIVGLANPGDQYAQTRHNVGAWLVQALADQTHTSLRPHSSFFGLYGKTKLANQSVHLLIPTTFMNASGKAVGALANFYNISPSDILVIHDELDLSPGYAKLKQGGGLGGHNGLKDIVRQLGNQSDFYRLRLGIGHPGHKNMVANYVLSKPSGSDLVLIEDRICDASRSIDIWFKDSFSQAQQFLHSQSPNS